VLRNQFINYMATDSPIRVALNMHSAIACKRYFVYHDAGGTSQAYAAEEKDFIGGVRQYFLSGIQDWSYFVSWVSSTPTQYPESWFWYNHREAVMALTYEDMNCSSAGQYDQTALAILQGIADYLGLAPTAVTDTPQAPLEFSLPQNYPNPVRLNVAGATATIIRYNLEQATPVRLSLYDVLGREISVLRDEHAAPGTYNVELDAGALPSGIYFYRLQTNSGMRVRRLLIAR